MSLYAVNQIHFNIIHWPVLLWTRVCNLYSFLFWDITIQKQQGKEMSVLNLQCSIRLSCFISETWQEPIDFPRSKQASANSLRQLMALLFSISQGLMHWMCTALPSGKALYQGQSTGAKWNISMGPRHAYVSGLVEEDEVRLLPLYPWLLYLNSRWALLNSFSEHWGEEESISLPHKDYGRDVDYLCGGHIFMNI